jgi:hypothetical protein
LDTAGIANSKRGAGGDAVRCDRRADERFDLNRAPGTLIHNGVDIPCEMLDVSLSGCRLRTLRPFTAGALESVKVILFIQEMVLSIWGITQWTKWNQLVGIYFVHPTGHTRNQLAGLLTCLLDKSVTGVVKQAIWAEAARANSPIIALEHPPVVAPPVEEEFQPEPPPPPPPKRPELHSEHRVLILQEGESPAALHLVAEDWVLVGDVLDVSQDACLMQLAHPLAVRENAPAELDFHLRGLPFRLPGVTLPMRDGRVVEIRFTQMSRRKQEGLSQAILELAELSMAAEKTA